MGLGKAIQCKSAGQRASKPAGQQASGPASQRASAGVRRTQTGVGAHRRTGKAETRAVFLLACPKKFLDWARLYGGSQRASGPVRVQSISGSRNTRRFSQPETLCAPIRSAETTLPGSALIGVRASNRITAETGRFDLPAALRFGMSLAQVCEFVDVSPRGFGVKRPLSRPPNAETQ